MLFPGQNCQRIAFCFASACALYCSFAVTDGTESIAESISWIISPIPVAKITSHRSHLVLVLRISTLSVPRRRHRDKRNIPSVSVSPVAEGLGGRRLASRVVSLSAGSFLCRVGEPCPSAAGCRAAVIVDGRHDQSWIHDTTWRAGSIGRWCSVTVGRAVRFC